MSFAVLTCTLCGEHNMFPCSLTGHRRENMMTFCKTCSTVTLHRVECKDEGRNHKDNIPSTTESLHTSADPYNRTPVFAPNDTLWLRLQKALADNGVAMGEFQHCDALTKSRLAIAFGFSEWEAQRLVDVAEMYDPRKILSAAQSCEPSSVVQSITPLRGSASMAEPVMQGQQQARKQEQEYFTSSTRRAEVSGQDFVMYESSAPVARCSVYPHLPAEFWCSLCGVLVSSRCHVTGFHKDHPFITLRQAAEAHVRDLKAWSERCRSQLSVANSILTNLHHSKEVLNTALKDQNEQLDKGYDEIVRALTEWRDELRSSIHMQIETQYKNIDMAMEKSGALIDYYASRQRICEPLLSSVPSISQVDEQAEDWSLRVMDLVANLKSSSVEPIAMPRLTIPDVKFMASPATCMELLKTVCVPADVSVPDVLDTGYLNFPNPSDVGRETFTLVLPEDAKARGILLYSGRTLTRSQDVTPLHSLVSASRVFYTGITAWEVHIDRIGRGPGRVLVGILMPGTDGEGVVWDGHRIVGPNEGECRVLSDCYNLQPGTTLRFLLELEAPLYFLVCYYEREVVARVPLPPSLSGWLPAFSVFGPQDQVTVVPSSPTDARQLSTALSLKKERAETGDETKKRFIEHEQKLNALQQQLLDVNSRISQDQHERLINPPKPHPPVSIDPSLTPRNCHPGDKGDAAHLNATEATPSRNDAMMDAVPYAGHELDDSSCKEDILRQSYSPELLSILNFVESIK